jgi:hypothetical protein
MPDADPAAVRLAELSERVERQGAAIEAHFRQEEKFREDLRRLEEEATITRIILRGRDDAKGIEAKVNELHDWLVGGIAGARIGRWFAAFIAAAITLAWMVSQLLHSLARH